MAFKTQEKLTEIVEKSAKKKQKTAYLSANMGSTATGCPAQPVPANSKTTAHMANKQMRRKWEATAAEAISFKSVS